MSRTRTLAELRADVRFESGMDNSRIWSSARIDRKLNEQISDVWDLLITARPDYYLQEWAPSTVAGTPTVALAASHYKLRRVEVTISGKQYPVYPINLSEVWRFANSTSVSRRWRYRIQGSNLVIVPTPAEVATLKIWYLPYAPTLVADGDTFDGISGYERLIVLLVAKEMHRRERMPIDGEWLKYIDEQYAKIKSAASELDAGEAYYLDGQGGRENEIGWPEELP